MRVAVVADAHISGPGGAAGPLVAQLVAAAERADRLLLLGDLFHVWIGRSQFATPDITAVADCLRRLRGNGLAIDYVEGNRDFFLADGPYANCFDRLATDLELVAGGRRVVAVHGDGLNDRDRQYLFWRWLSKSALVRVLMTSLPAGLAQRVVGDAEARLARTNFKHRAQIPEEAIRRFASRRLAKPAPAATTAITATTAASSGGSAKGNADLLVLGHFHEERRWNVPGGEVWLLDAWFRSRRVEWLE